jgi:hypothetical protein
MLRTAFLVASIAASVLIPTTVLQARGGGGHGGGGHGAEAGAVAPSMSGEVGCIWAEAECIRAVGGACVLSAAVDAAFGTAVGTRTESARAGS